MNPGMSFRVAPHLLFRVAVAVLLTLSAVACAGKGANPPPGTAAVDYRACPRPDWADNPSCEGAYCAVGLGRSMDYGFAREKAEADGRARLAQMLEVDVDRVFDQLKKENVEFDNALKSAGFDMARSVNQQVTSTTLSGSRPVSYYNDCVQGNVYALMVLDFDVLRSSLQDAMKAQANQLQGLREEELNDVLEDMHRLIEQRRAERFSRSAPTMGK